MTWFFRIAAVLAGSAVVAAGPAEPWGRVVVTDGGGILFPPRTTKRVSPAPNVPVPGGSTIQTVEGRLEIDIAPNATLRIAGGSELEVTTLDGGWTIRLVRGRIELEIWGTEGSSPRLSTEFGTVDMESGSLVLLTRGPDSAILDVRSGVAEVRRDTFATLVTAPVRVLLRRGTPTFAASENASGRLRDDFRYWVEERRAARTRERARGRTLWEAYGRELLASGGELVPCPWGDAVCFSPVTGFVGPGDGEWLRVEGNDAWVPEDLWGWVTSHYGAWVSANGRWWWRPGDSFQPGPEILKSVPQSSEERHPLAAFASTRP